MWAHGMMHFGLGILPAALKPALRVGPAAARAGGVMRASVESLGRPDVVVVGGGFGGLYTALRLANLGWEEAEPPRRHPTSPAVQFQHFRGCGTRGWRWMERDCGRTRPKIVPDPGG